MWPRFRKSALITIVLGLVYVLSLQQTSLVSVDDYCRPRGLKDSAMTKFLWVDHYSEQMGRAASSFADLVTLAHVLNRSVVEPFVHNSRMSGYPRRSNGKNRPFSLYYDMEAVNRLLITRRYRCLVTFDVLIDECKCGWDVVVLFVYASKSVNPARHFAEINKCQTAARSSADGTHDCPALVDFIRPIPAEKGLRCVPDFSRTRGVVINLDRFRSLARLEKDVFRSKRCVQLFNWAGQGQLRAHFDLPKRHIIEPPELSHSRRLLGIVRKLIEKNVGARYVGLHIRTEKMMKSPLTVKQISDCIRMAVERAEELKKWVVSRMRPAISLMKVKIVLSTDLFANTSDTMGKNSRDKLRAELVTKNKEILNRTLQIGNQGFDDSGAQAIVDMHLVAEADALVVVGGGNFQEWIVSLYEKKNGVHGRVERLCARKTEGWDRKARE